MQNATQALDLVLTKLTLVARRVGLTDTAWAAAAGVRKETLSRLRSRRTCDFATLDALARSVGARIEVLEAEAAPVSADGHFPGGFTRDDEERLLNLAAARNLDPQAWRAAGPGFFMAGFAVLLASVRGMDRRALLALAERLHPGSSQVAAFSLWLERSPVQASRFMPMLSARLQHAA